MILVLSETVHAAALGDDLVLLDVAADAYYCLPDGDRRLRLQADRRSFAPLDEDACALLLEAGLASKGSRPATARRSVARPVRGLSTEREARLTVREGLRLGLCLLDAVGGYWRRPFPAILAAASRQGPAAQGMADVAVIARLAAAFRQVVIWLPISGKCLLRSYVLLRFLQRSGHGAEWIIGVRTWPFGSHCWLQVGDMVLDDVPERLAAYEPILSVAG